MSDITPQTIADRLQTLATEMLDIAAEMDYFGGFSAIGQHGKALSIAAMRVQGWVEDIREDYPTEAPATPDQPTDRAALQAAGTHPAPCARHCEANAYQIEMRHISAERDALAARPAPAMYSDALDAKRYRALRRGQAWSVIDGIGDDLRGAALDAAIDAREALNDQPKSKGD